MIEPLERRDVNRLLTNDIMKSLTDAGATDNTIDTALELAKFAIHEKKLDFDKNKSITYNKDDNTVDFKDKNDTQQYKMPDYVRNEEDAKTHTANLILNHSNIVEEAEKIEVRLSYQESYNSLVNKRVEEVDKISDFDSDQNILRLKDRPWNTMPENMINRLQDMNEEEIESSKILQENINIPSEINNKKDAIEYAVKNEKSWLGISDNLLGSMNQDDFLKMGSTFFEDLKNGYDESKLQQIEVKSESKISPKKSISENSQSIKKTENKGFKANFKNVLNLVKQKAGLEAKQKSDTPKLKM